MSEFHGNPLLLRCFIKRHKCQHASGARGKVRGLRKSLVFILWETLMFVQNFMVIHQTFEIFQFQSDGPTDIAIYRVMPQAYNM